MTKSWMQSRQEKHDTFARLPRASREAAMRYVRQRKSFNEMVTIEELLSAHEKLIAPSAHEMRIAKTIYTNKV